MYNMGTNYKFKSYSSNQLQGILIKLMASVGPVLDSFQSPRKISLFTLLKMGKMLPNVGLV